MGDCVIQKWRTQQGLCLLWGKSSRAKRGADNRASTTLRATGETSALRHSGIPRRICAKNRRTKKEPAASSRWLAAGPIAMGGAC
jgi:hypothetical protein